MVMEAEKSQSLQCEVTISKRANGESACLGPKAERDQCPSSR